MARKRSKVDARTEQGRALARKLFDYPLAQLEKLAADDRSRLGSEFPLLGEIEFQDVLRQVIEAKTYERDRIGWQAIPHDATVLVTVIVTALLDLRAGIIAGVATLVLSESLLQFYFDRRLYKPLSMLVWLTYPAYGLLAYVLYHRGWTIPWIVIAVGLLWGATFFLGGIARLPIRLILEGREKGAKETAATRRKRTTKGEG
jgi:hypothetical protein